MIRVQGARSKGRYRAGDVLSISEVGVARLSTSVAHRWCRRLHEEEEGVSLIEILIASFILVVAVLGIATTAGASLSSVRVSRDRDAAATAASAGVEAARDLGFGRLALDTGNTFTGDVNVVGGQFKHDGTASEDLVLASGGVTPYRCTPATADCWFPFQDYGNLDSATLYVTAFDDPNVDGNNDSVMTNDVDGKRATVVISWTDANTVRTVRQSTIIAESKRGLGLPEFQVSPLAQTLLVAPDEAVCVGHSIFNAGAADSYDLIFEKPVDANFEPSLSTDTANAITIHTKSGTSVNHKWTARAWFGPTAASDSKTWFDAWSADPATTNELDATRLRETDGDGRLETPYTLPRDSAADLVICYTHGDSVATEMPQDVLLRPIIRSQLGLVVGEDKSTTLDHTISIGTTVSGVYLAAVEGQGTFTTALPDPIALPDYAPTDGIPGLTIDKPATAVSGSDSYFWSSSAADVQAEFTTARLHLWTSWTDAIQFGSTAKMSLSFTAHLCVVDVGVETCAGAPSARSFSTTYEHASAGWCNHGVSTQCPTAITWDFGTDTQDTTGRQLLLEVICTSSDSQADCHLAFGTETFPARLDLT